VRSLLIKTSLILLSVIFAVGLAEVFLRLTRYGEANGVHLERLMDYDPVLGWRHKRNSSIELVTREYHTTLQFDAHGVRGFDPPYSKPPGVSRIVVLGDSFVEGYAVQMQDRFTEVLQATLGSPFQVIALGVAAYSTDQELLTLEQEGWKYQPDLVVLAFYYNDVWGNASRSFGPLVISTQKPVFVMDAGGNLTLTNVPVPYPKPTLQDRFKVYDLIRKTAKRSWLLRWLAVKAGLADAQVLESRPMGGVGSADEFEVYQRTETEKVEREWGITQALLRRMKQETDQRAAHSVVFYVPTRVELSAEEWSSLHIPPEYDPGEVAKRLVGICKAEGIPYIEPSDRFREAAQQGRLYYVYDPHWNPAGNRVAAGILAQYVASLWQLAHQ
jgi:hypothetical protein